MPARAARPRAEVIAGYTVVERRERARLAAPDADHDDGQVVRHPRPDGAVARDGRRGRRPARARSPHVGERRAPPAFEHEQLIFDCFAQVEHLSTAFTLEPGRRDHDGHALQASAAR
jgi:hypothetical protein